MSETVTGTSKKEKQQYKKRKIVTCHISPSSSLFALRISGSKTQLVQQKISGLTTIKGENAVSPCKILRTNNDMGRKRGSYNFTLPAPLYGD